jgi:hypothetical protein
MSCFWYFSSKLAEFDEETWVVKDEIVDESLLTLYITSQYWTFATMITVGYGDLSAGSVAEMLIAIFWMVLGAGIYSFAIGNLSSVLSNMDTK